MLQELRRQISAALYGWHYPLVTSMYPCFDCDSNGIQKEPAHDRAPPILTNTELAPPWPVQLLNITRCYLQLALTSPRLGHAASPHPPPSPPCGAAAPGLRASPRGLGAGGARRRASRLAPGGIPEICMSHRQHRLVFVKEVF